MKLILHLKQLSPGHYILFLGDKWTGCAAEELSTKEMRQCKQIHCKPPTAYLFSIPALLSPAAHTNGKSQYFPSLKQSKQELSPLFTNGHYLELQASKVWQEQGSLLGRHWLLYECLLRVH